MSLQSRFKKPISILDQRLLPPKQAATYIGVSIDIIYEMIKARQVPHIVKPGNGRRIQYLIDRHDLDRWIDRRKITAVAA
jgi:excisionase family DNA binding protein